MTTVVLIARLVLVGVFTLAGVAKLMNLAGSREAVEEFGVPSQLAGIIGTALPFGEIAVALALLPAPSARWGAIGAAVLLAVFSVGAGNALRKGLAPDCNCFGQVASEPVSARTLVRNGILGALALFAAIGGPGAALSSWTTSRSAADILAALATVTAAVLATVVYARRGATPINADAVVQVDDADSLQRATPGPDFELPGLDGIGVSLRQLLARDRPVVLVFASAVCPPCVGLLPHLARWNRVIGNDVTLVVIESGWDSHQLTHGEQDSLGGLVTLTEPKRDLASAYRAPGTPCAISLTPDGLISSPPMPGTAQVERLIRQVLETGQGMPASTASDLAVHA